jgi:hypothetical protein
LVDAMRLMISWSTETMHSIRFAWKWLNNRSISSVNWRDVNQLVVK